MFNIRISQIQVPKSDNPSIVSKSNNPNIVLKQRVTKPVNKRTKANACSCSKCHNNHLVIVLVKGFHITDRNKNMRNTLH